MDSSLSSRPRKNLLGCRRGKPSLRRLMHSWSYCGPLRRRDGPEKRTSTLRKIRDSSVDRVIHRKVFLNDSRMQWVRNDVLGQSHLPENSRYSGTILTTRSTQCVVRERRTVIDSNRMVQIMHIARIVQRNQCRCKDRT